MINIAYRWPVVHLVYAFSNGQQVPEPLEPGEISIRNQNTLVERVSFDHGYKRTPHYRYHTLGSGSSLDDALANVLNFRKGEEYLVRLKPEWEPVQVRVLTQTSLMDGAHVHFTYGEMNAIYSVHKTPFEKKMLVRKISKRQESPPSTNSSTDLHKIAV